MIAAIQSGGGGNSSGQNKAFDQTIFMFMFYIKASYKYVNSDADSLVSQGTYTFETKQILQEYHMIVCILWKNARK